MIVCCRMAEIGVPGQRERVVLTRVAITPIGHHRGGGVAQRT
jgi:hypothetical protein